MAKTTKAKPEENGAAKAAEGGAKDAAQAAGPAANQATQPLLSVLAQYIKDLSFENPNAPNSLRPREKSPEINININVNANGLGDNNFEVVLLLEAKAMADKEVVFNAELTYAGIFRLQGIPAESMQPALLIECPRILFPFARQILSEATRNGGFPPLMIDPVDFARLYQSRLQQQSTATN